MSWSSAQAGIIQASSNSATVVAQAENAKQILSKMTLQLEKQLDDLAKRIADAEKLSEQLRSVDRIDKYEDNIEEIFKQDIAKAGGMEHLMEQTVEWEHTLLRSVQIGPIDAGLENLEAQGLIRKKSDKKCLYDYELTDGGKYSLEQYQKITTLR